MPPLATHSSTPVQPHPPGLSSPQSRNDFVLLSLLAASTVLLHFFTANRYGFNRDELAILEDARHLAWGYVSYPPLTPFFGRLSLSLFGTSLVGFRLFSSLLQAAGVLLTGTMAKEMGGGRFAQLVSASAAIPFALGVGAIMQYTSFDYFAWVLTSFFVVKLLHTANPRHFLTVWGVGYRFLVEGEP